MLSDDQLRGDMETIRRRIRSAATEGERAKWQLELRDCQDLLAMRAELKKSQRLGPGGTHKGAVYYGRRR